MRAAPFLLATSLLMGTVLAAESGSAMEPFADASAEPSAEPAAGTERPVLRLHGAFGTVVGGPPDAPATAYPGVGLDPFLRGAPLRLLTDEEHGAVRTRSVIAFPVDGRDEQLLSDGAIEFEGPDTVGATIVVARVEFAGVESRHAWLLAVPDRIGDTDALLEVVPPGILLSSGQGQMAGTPGNGCYAYLCSDIGGLGPVGRLEALPVSVGETLTVGTDDGSGLVGWVGRLRPVEALSDIIAEGSGPPDDAVADELPLRGLEAPRAGEWLLELRVDFDRERGWLWHAYRLLAE